MRPLFALTAMSAAALAVPAIAADPAPKTKKVCKAVNNGNPLFPQIKCHTVDVEAAAVPVVAAPATPVDQAAAPTPTQVATNRVQPQ